MVLNPAFQPTAAFAPRSVAMRSALAMGAAATLLLDTDYSRRARIEDAMIEADRYDAERELAELEAA